VWVFLNGKLAVDLGGIHEAAAGSITLDAATATKFNLTKGKVYEIALFQAERKQTRSSYKLTVGQFNRTHTVCKDRCGDGIINGGEASTMALPTLTTPTAGAPPSARSDPSAATATSTPRTAKSAMTASTKRRTDRPRAAAPAAVPCPIVVMATWTAFSAKSATMVP
jgi:fibro-slime domain-containing protein